uniref:NADH-ubiquinone oxidoreductase chain 2 n=1 Tax=Arthonia quintaria TaxID=2563724 RepID=A0A4P8VVJ4_9PEZI|nr:NADH dehydrogenase subunit 2 [Arthonia quintaria]
MLLVSIIGLISSNAVAFRRDKSIIYSRSVIATLVVCIIISNYTFDSTFLDKGIGLFHGLFHSTAITHIFQIFIFAITALILQLNSFYPRKIWTSNFSSLYKLIFYKLVYFNSFLLNKMAEQFRILEYSLIILFVVIGGVFLVSCFDLISIFLAIELQSYGLYLLCSIFRDSEKATSAGLTYFLLGGLSSCFILLASSLLYGNSGNTGFDGFYVISNIYAADSGLSEYTNEFSLSYKSYYINSALIIMSVGFLFKVTAAPFHFWSPDVYDAIPTIVTTFVAIFAKISIFVLLLELVHYTTSTLNSDLNLINSAAHSQNNFSNFYWTFTLLMSCLLSLIIGSVLGLTQYRIKRLYAYSTISHVGFILLALSINSIESIQSFIFYLMQYTISNLNAFLLLICVGFSLYLYVEKENRSDNITARSAQSYDRNLTSSLSDKKNSPLQLISQLQGYYFINPFLALSLAITIFSFVGIPPLIGFFAKQMILSSALDNGYIFMAFIAILTSVISAYYYLTLIKQMFFHKSSYIKNPQLENVSIKGLLTNKLNNKSNYINVGDKNIVLSSSLSVTISVLTLIILLFILNPQEWLSMANILALILFNS